MVTRILLKDQFELNNDQCPAWALMTGLNQTVLSIIGDVCFILRLLKESHCSMKLPSLL